MNKYITILGNLDRRIIFLLIGLSVLIPLVKPNWVKLPIKIDKILKSFMILFQILKKMIKYYYHLPMVLVRSQKYIQWQ